MKTRIDTKNAPAAVGPYSQAIVADKLIFISGQLPVDPETGAFVSENPAEQAEQSLKNIKAILEEAGLTMNDVVKTTVFLTDMGNFVPVNDVYKTFFEGNFPARSAIQVGALPKGAQVEIEAVAFRP